MLRAGLIETGITLEADGVPMKTCRQIGIGISRIKGHKEELEGNLDSAGPACAIRTPKFYKMGPLIAGRVCCSRTNNESATLDH